ncbi:CDP-diacylglycerol--glycerol-3-phosphate 3-phosphatidyltransferase, mitochondrial [Phlebotomus argentipes]|uniref:CDP-diacylglycerol--glycerol-3-phosphate 3-phosphatidyltransferase, mitochondrial n=1 Tax=Phlebotomus argentipes TaxID=94469 RepID=UPI002893111D|nr:CDP-diacylglycerol--glycerol-3-phosphate 3-phosphatidyltransferase, mitochondrial [Phlebotomus argentipes]
MSIMDFLLSWPLLILQLLKMIRRLFATFIEQPVQGQAAEVLPSPAPLPGRQFSNPRLQSLSWLHAAAPCFPVRGDCITVIHDPRVFYETVLSKCASAKRRIILASLYLGIGQLETKLISVLRENLRENKKLEVDFLLDFTRGTRGKVSSRTTIMPLIEESDNVSLSLYHTPALRGITKKLAPPRWNELLGLQHMKVYLFDNSVIISGANLSTDYFTNRQDRYIMIENKSLADFYAGLVGKVQEFSVQVSKDAQLQLNPSWIHWPYEGSQNDFVQEARNRIFSYFSEVVERQKNSVDSESDADTWIFPVIEMGQLGIHHDSVVTKAIFQNSQCGSRIRMATGYFNLTQEYMNSITDCQAECAILMAHPNANGFKGAKGPAGGIPDAYTLIARQFHEKLTRAQQDHRVSLFEYQLPGWTYHAKGLWYYLPDSSLPAMTLIGSSNFGERSVNRDLETQVCIVTENVELQKRLEDECNNLYRLGTAAESEITRRNIPRWVRAVVSVFKNFF